MLAAHRGALLFRHRGALDNRRVQARKREPELAVIESLADVPEFTSEKEEADFWATHTLAEGLLEEMRPLTEEEAPGPQRTRAISLRIDEELLKRLQALADQNNTPYQSILKQFIRERVGLEESKAAVASRRGSFVPHARR